MQQRSGSGGADVGPPATTMGWAEWWLLPTCPAGRHSCAWKGWEMCGFGDESNQWKYWSKPTSTPIWGILPIFWQVSSPGLMLKLSQCNVDGFIGRFTQELNWKKKKKKRPVLKNTVTNSTFIKIGYKYRNQTAFCFSSFYKMSFSLFWNKVIMASISPFFPPKSIFLIKKKKIRNFCIST